LAETRQRAQALILAGQVFVNDVCVDKPGKLVERSAAVDVKVGGPLHVSRGWQKLEGAIQEFHLSVERAICLDVGASTGGFTEYLVEHGASRVFAVDVGRGQLHWRLRSDPRVVVMEGINARYLNPTDFPTQFDLVTIDVSFISLTKILPAVVPLVKPEGLILALIKPQFEVGKGEVGKGGIVRDPRQHQQVVNQIRIFAQQQLHLLVKGVRESPLLGAEGNQEFFILLAKEAKAAGHEIGAVTERA
jgi:23S rRNA (cytidine1920-2'-O)/16S rRNA (cytidine1409-2'-O)-methyltransferase